MSLRYGRWCRSMSVLFVSVALPLVAKSSRAESISAGALSETLQVAEPVLVNVTLRLDEPFRKDIESSREAAEQSLRLKHRLVVELWADGQRVASAFIGGVSFLPSQDGCNEVNATVMGWFGVEKSEGGRSGFKFWMIPGKYRVIVAGVESGLEADAFFVEINPAAEPMAAELLTEGELDALALLYLQPEYGQSAVAAFERVASDYSETVHGQYARSALAIRTAVRARTHSERTDSKVDDVALAVELQAASSLFQEGHPMRTRTLFELARVFLRNQETERALAVARRAVSESTNASHRDASQELVDAIMRRSVAQTPTPSP